MKDKDYNKLPKKGWIVREEDDNKIHVRPIKNGEILDTPVEKVISYKESVKKC